MYSILRPVIGKCRLVYSAGSNVVRCSVQSLVTESTDSGDKTHFGFTQVNKEDKQKKVYEVFKNVAEKYDLMNDAMSFGIHRIWKDCFVEKLNPVPGMKILDVAGGTGDIAFRMVTAMNHRRKEFNVTDKEANVVVCDINDVMLTVGEKRAEKLGIAEHLEWLQGDAQKLPFEDNTFDAYTIAYGIRNVTDVNLALREAHRVLKKGGRFMCLEFSHVENEELQWLYDQFSFQIIPVMGTVLAGDWKSYQYLVESIRKFPKQEVFLSMMHDAGFTKCSFTNMTFGVTAIHSGFKL